MWEECGTFFKKDNLLLNDDPQPIAPHSKKITLTLSITRQVTFDINSFNQLWVHDEWLHDINTYLYDDGTVKGEKPAASAETFNEMSIKS